MKTDILKGLMFYTVKGSGTFYPISLENVKMVLEMNANGKKPADITDLAEAEEKTAEESIEFADVVGQISLASLEKKSKKQHSKPNKQSQHTPDAQKRTAPQNKPFKQNQHQNRHFKKDNQPNRMTLPTIVILS
jgi:hypothetical protein